MALRNTDNHARNTALQRLEDGTIQLTPLYDFAPMFLDPEMVPRISHWVFSGRRVSDLGSAIERLGFPADEKRHICVAMRDFATQIETLPEVGQDCGIESNVIASCLRNIDRVADDLSKISV